MYRHFPGSRFGSSLPAAIAAECAAQEGRFVTFAALLFASQDTLVRLPIDAVAAQAGVLDTARFHSCRIGTAARARVMEDMRAAKALGITATPTFLIGDQLFVGEIPGEELEEVVRLAIQKPGRR